MSPLHSTRRGATHEIVPTNATPPSQRGTKGCDETYPKLKSMAKHSILSLIDMFKIKLNKTKYTMDPGIYVLMKTNKEDIMIKVLKIA